MKITGLKAAKKRVDHFNEVVKSFNFLIEKKAVVVDGVTFKLYLELWTSEAHAKAWMKNAYIYMRTLRKIKEGTPLFFRDIETGDLIGTYQGGTVRYLIRET